MLPSFEVASSWVAGIAFAFVEDTSFVAAVDMPLVAPVVDTEEA